MKMAIGFVAGTIIGFVAHGMVTTGPSLAYHWRVVLEYRAYVLDPANYTRDPQTGLWSTEPPSDPLPSLAALVAADELNHIDIVLPTVPYKNREANRFWMDFCSKHDGIIHAIGNPSHETFPISGEQPLHLNLWFTDKAVADVQRLINTLERISREKAPSMKPTATD